MKGIISGVTAAIIGILALAFWPMASVPNGHVGIITVFGKPQTEAILPGLNYVGFFAHVHDFNIQQQAGNFKAAAGTKDLQSVHTIVTVNYHPSSASAVSLYSEVGADYSDKLLTPAVHDRTKAVTALYTAEELITKRDRVVREVREGITELVRARSGNRVIVDSVVITDFGFDPAFAAAILAKQVSEQTAQKAKYDLEKAQIDARQRVAEAEANARAFQVQARELTEPMLRMEWIKKWDGSLPQYMLGGSGTMLVLPTPQARATQ